MRSFAVMFVGAALAGCAAPQFAERLPVRPAPALPLAPVVPEHQEPRPAQPALPVQDDAATRAWLEQEIERNRYVPPPPPVEVVERVVERPVYVRDPDQGYRAYHAAPYYGYYDGYYDGYGRYDRRYSHNTFPLHTALGAGIGAVIGHQSGHRGRGAWIGSGLGLLIDLGSHW